MSSRGDVTAWEQFLQGSGGIISADRVLAHRIQIAPRGTAHRQQLFLIVATGALQLYGETQ
jgi:hypothetical protein